MPLYDNKPVAPVPEPKLDPSKHGNKQVWVIPYSNEVFVNYKDYLNRIAFYNRPEWQCAVTSKQGLTYEEALENEKKHREQLKKFPEGLKQHILQMVQFSTDRLDVLANQIFDKYNEEFTLGEHVTIKDESEGKKRSKGKVIDVKISTVPAAKGIKGKSFRTRKQTASTQAIYRVQMLDKQGSPIQQVVKNGNHRYMIKTFNGGDNLRFVVNVKDKHHQDFSTTKDTYLHAPWIVKDNLAKKYKVNTKLPDDLKKAKSEAREKSRKRKGKTIQEGPSKKARTSKGMNTRTRGARREDNAQKDKRGTISANTTRGKRMAASKRQATMSKEQVKRAAEKKRQKEREKKKREAERKREKERKAKEREAQKRLRAEQRKTKYPIEDLDVPLDRSLLSKKPPMVLDFKIPQKYIGTFLMTWNFFTVFGKPLGVSFFTLDDLELSFYHNMMQPRCTLVIEMHAALLNAIIRDRLQARSKKRQPVPRVAPALRDQIKTETGPNDMDVDINGNSVLASRDALERFVKIWDKKVIPPKDSRKGWECVLIGCLYQLGTHETIPNVDRILSHLAPIDSTNASEESFEEYFTTLEVADKLQIMEFLINNVAKTTLIHEHIEGCVNKQTELNKEKNEIIKERKHIANSLAEITKGNVSVPRVKGKSSTESMNGEDSLVSRKLKLEEEDLALQKKEEHVEKEKRRYALPRTGPMGYDRFHNKYYYFDEAGLVVNERYGTGRVLVQVPSTKELADTLTEAMRQKYNKRRKVEESFGTEETQWGYYEDSEQVDDLLKWFNEKGKRELILKKEISSRLLDIKSGMVKRVQDLIASRKTAEVRRSRRTQATKALLSQQSYMKWTNKLSK
ncbi:955_t:CDS:10 [Funneliformis mosseae]|uniref:955_t:CDS:1 n=1 Tax=Funneliformis mosseae TaxID=27381 RepID=A0A9N9A9K4_FUNMO|nr:955_t:CDS:10 [Funneliformis mosseae]